MCISTTSAKLIAAIPAGLLFLFLCFTALKTTLTLQVAIIALMAQIGSFVPASSAELPIFDAIFLRIGAKDNLFAGKSTLAVELDEAGLILRQATSRSHFFGPDRKGAFAFVLFC